MEGSPVLYGENWFSMETRPFSARSTPVQQTWPMERHSKRDLAKLTVRVADICGDDDRWTLYSRLPKMHGLRVVEFCAFPRARSLFGIKELIDVATSYVKHVPQVRLRLDVHTYNSEGLGFSNPPADAQVHKLLHTLRYGPAGLNGEKTAEPSESVGLEGTDAWPNRQVSWDFIKCTDELAMSYGVLGFLVVYLTWGGLKYVQVSRHDCDED